jgi:hypothetical protein
MERLIRANMGLVKIVHHSRTARRITFQDPKITNGLQVFSGIDQMPNDILERI